VIVNLRTKSVEGLALPFLANWLFGKLAVLFLSSIHAASLLASGFHRVPTPIISYTEGKHIQNDDDSANS
jgi:hypothetical protein